MKMLSTAGCTIVVFGLASGLAAESNSLRFGLEPLGVPPLSLSETIKDRASISKQFDSVVLTCRLSALYATLALVLSLDEMLDAERFDD